MCFFYVGIFGTLTVRLLVHRFTWVQWLRGPFALWGYSRYRPLRFLPVVLRYYCMISLCNAQPPMTVVHRKVGCLNLPEGTRVTGTISCEDDSRIDRYT